MQSRSGSLASKAAALLCVLLLAGFDSGPRPGQVLDEARAAGRDAASFPAADEDYFHDMDGGVALTPDEIKGRNMWIVWTGGNDRFWDGMTASTFGAFDLLKIVASDPTMKVRPRQALELSRPGQRAVLRRSRPARSEPLRPVARRARAGLPARSVRERDEISGRRRSARAGKTVPVGSYYG